jgi:beta-ribofuranosylaminobenzene 5'-phosphate synthase
MNCVRVVAPAHLHAGNFDLNGGLGRLYGTVGFTIDYPKLVIEVEKAVGVEASNTLAERFARAVAQSFGVTGFRVVVRESFPEYVGLGYVTTLGIAIGLGVSELFRLRLSAEDMALAIRRGLVTTLGVYACKVGGFIVEGGFEVLLSGPISKRDLILALLTYHIANSTCCTSACNWFTVGSLYNYNSCAVALS